MCFTRFAVLVLVSVACAQVIVVDKSGSIKTIAAALAKIPSGSTTRHTIVVHPGTYSEKITITPEMGPVTISGSDSSNPDKVLLRTGCAATGDGTAGCSSCTGGEWNSQALLIKSPNFIAQNLAIANDACNYNHKKAGQSFAVQNLADKVTFINVRMYGGQDTFYTGGASTRVYMLNSFVNGSVDSIFGIGAAVFDKCEIQISSYNTAHRGDASLKTSYLFLNSRLTKPKGAATGGSRLGRPWGQYARVIFKSTSMAGHIGSIGWDDWGHKCTATSWCSNVFYAEYKSSGAGASSTGRPGWTKQLSDTEAAKYTTSTTLRGWAPPTGVRSTGEIDQDADNTTTWVDPDGYASTHIEMTELVSVEDSASALGVALTLSAAKSEPAPQAAPNAPEQPFIPAGDLTKRFAPQTVRKFFLFVALLVVLPFSALFGLQLTLTRGYGWETDKAIVYSGVAGIAVAMLVQVVYVVLAAFE
eukprot:m51a1_g11830 hypothetical protein (473) ;mRNA; f:437613-439546